VTSKTEEEATAELQAAGYTVIRKEEASRLDEGTVISQDPLTGSELPPGSPVTITVSIGPEQFVVPDVANMSIVDASELLRENFRIAGQIEQASATVDALDVIGTDPPKGTLLADQAPITIIVSSGIPRIEVPDVVGLFADSAIQGLQNRGLTPVSEFTPVAEGSADVGRVVGQTPPPFLEVESGSVVTILVGQAVEEPTTTSSTTTTTTTTTTVPDGG